MIERPKTAKDRIILALDVDNLKEARELVRELKDYVGYFKVGLPLIVNYGFEAFRLLEEHGASGSRMTSAVVKASRAAAKSVGIEPPTILGVTLLSSFGQKTLTTELCVDKNIEDFVLQLAKVAKETGLDGVVASAEEARRIRKEIGDDFIILCPATRPTWSSVNDQVRVDTPRDAILAGVDFMVVGRPITSAEDRIGAANMIIDEIETALEEKAALV